MRISTNVGVGIDRPKTIAEIVEEVRRAADLGLGGAWWAERHTADALTAATVAGLAVPELPLGTAVVTTYPRHPLALASQALTVQAATGNRLTLGIGPGHKQRVETTLGMSFDRPALHTREYLSALMPLLHGESVEFSGEIHHVAGQVPTPGAQPPTVLLAALGPVMLRTAGELADGTVTVWTGVRTIATHIAPRITAAADAAGRPAPRVVVNLPIAVTDDPDGARTWIADHFGASSLVPSYRAMFELEGARGGADVVVVGDERHVEKELHRFADAGATEFIAVPFGSPKQVTRTLTFLGNLHQTPIDS
ncbi:MAG: class F420-dependent oxidoreductase [Actinomycetia bacterium]|nr:class F420-dependent oxidoreductase [Actinomycetes bacterium]